MAKKKFKDEHGGRLFCEVCDFDFGRVYGKKGEGFIEAHHITPLKDIDGVHEVTTDDLAMVCSNCHSMLHRTGKSIKGLKKLIAR